MHFTILCLVGWGLLFGLNYMFPIANVLTLVVGVGTYGWVLGMFYNIAFRKYLPNKEDNKEENEKETEENMENGIINEETDVEVKGETETEEKGK